MNRKNQIIISKNEESPVFIILDILKKYGIEEKDEEVDEMIDKGEKLITTIIIEEFKKIFTKEISEENFLLTLEKILKSMRVKKIKEIGCEKCDYATAKKLKKITSSTIDLRLRPKKRYYQSKIYSNKKSRANINQSGKKLALKNKTQKSSFWRFFINNL